MKQVQMDGVSASAAGLHGASPTTSRKTPSSANQDAGDFAALLTQPAKGETTTKPSAPLARTDKERPSPNHINAGREKDRTSKGAETEARDEDTLVGLAEIHSVMTAPLQKKNSLTTSSSTKTLAAAAPANSAAPASTAQTGAADVIDGIFDRIMSPPAAPGRTASEQNIPGRNTPGSIERAAPTSSVPLSQALLALQGKADQVQPVNAEQGPTSAATPNVKSAPASNSEAAQIAASVQKMASAQKAMETVSNTAMAGSDLAARKAAAALQDANGRQPAQTTLTGEKGLTPHADVRNTPDPAGRQSTPAQIRVEPQTQAQIKPHSAEQPSSAQPGSPTQIHPQVKQQEIAQAASAQVAEARATAQSDALQVAQTFAPKSNAAQPQADSGKTIASNAAGPESSKTATAGRFGGTATPETPAKPTTSAQTTPPPLDLGLSKLDGDAGFGETADLDAVKAAGAERSGPGAPPAALRNASSVATQAWSSVIQRFDARSQQYQIRLDPAELGEIDVSIEITKDHKARIVMAVQSHEAMHQLLKSSQALEQALAQSGVDLQEDGLNFELSENESGSFTFSGDDQDNEDQNASSPAQNAASSTQDDEPLERVISPTLTVWSRPGVNLRA